MDNFTYIFTRSNGRLFGYDEKGADRLMFGGTSWKAKDFVYQGRMPLRDYTSVIEECEIAITKTHKAGEMPKEQEKQELDRRQQAEDKFKELVLAKVKELNDKSEPRDFSILTQNGNLQKDTRVTSMVR